MLSAILAGTARHPRWVLGGVLAVAVTLTGVHLLAAPDSDTRYAIPALLPLFALTLITLQRVALTRWRPAGFIVDTPASAFRTLPQPSHVYNAAGSTLFSATAVTTAVNFRNTYRDLAPLDPTEQVMNWSFVILPVLLVAVSVLLIAQVVWRGVGVQLRPDGLTDRSAFGTITVPWDALTTHSLPPTTPSAISLRLTYARPDLVRVTGLPLTRRRISADTINALFLAHTIHHYLLHPQHRQHIGTAAGYAELVNALHGPRQR